MEHELTKEQLEIQQLDNQIDSGLDAVATLESYGELLKQSGADGISRQSAAILNVGLSNCYKVLSLESQSTGLESYVTCTSRDGLLKAEVSFESITSKIKAGAKRVWEWILKILESIKKFYGRIGDVAVKLKNDIKGFFKKTEETKESTEDTKEDSDLKEGEYKLSTTMANKLTAFIENNKFILDSKTKAYVVLMKFGKELPETAAKHYVKMEEIIVNSEDNEMITNSTKMMGERALQISKILAFAKFEMANFCKFNFNGFNFENLRYDFEFENLIPETTKSSSSSEDSKVLKARSTQEIKRDLGEIEDSIDVLQDLSSTLQGNSDGLMKMVSKLKGNYSERATEIAPVINAELSLFKSKALMDFISFYLTHNRDKIAAMREENKVAR